MTTDGEIKENTQMVAKTIGGGSVSGEIGQCKAILKQGSFGWNGQRVSIPGERCRRKHKLVNGLCWVHRKFPPSKVIGLGELVSA